MSGNGMEFRSFGAPSVRNHVAPSDVEPQGTVLGLQDAIGTLAQPGVGLMRDVQDGRFARLDTVVLVGLPARGKTTLLAQWIRGWQARALQGKRPLRVEEVDIAPIFMDMRQESGIADTNLWGSSEFDEVDRRFGIKFAQARRVARLNNAAGNRTIVVAEMCGTNIVRPDGVRVNRGGGTWMGEVAQEAEFPDDKRTILPVAITAESDATPVRGGVTRALVTSDIPKRQLPRALREEGVHVVGLGRRSPGEIIKGAPLGAIRQAEREMAAFVKQNRNDATFKAHLARVKSLHPALSLQAAQEAAAWATILGNVGTLGRVGGYSTVLENPHRQKVRFHVPDA